MMRSIDVDGGDDISETWSRDHNLGADEEEDDAEEVLAPPLLPLIAQPLVPPKRGRGRPRKNTLVTEALEAPVQKRGRGRPRKSPIPAKPTAFMIHTLRRSPRKCRGNGLYS